MAGGFNETYLQGRAPWDIGRAQPEFVRLAEEGAIAGRVLDVGCGTGENALFLAAAGCDVTGVDGAPAAIERATRKAEERHLAATFHVADVLDLSAYAAEFDAVIDSGCLHVFDAEGRARYERSVHGVLRPSGRLFVLCFSERQPGDWGPHRFTEAELRSVFATGWSVDWMRRAHFDVLPTAIPELDRDASPPHIEAWLMAATRISDAVSALPMR